MWKTDAAFAAITCTGREAQSMDCQLRGTAGMAECFLPPEL